MWTTVCKRILYVHQNFISSQLPNTHFSILLVDWIRNVNAVSLWRSVLIRVNHDCWIAYINSSYHPTYECSRRVTAITFHEMIYLRSYTVWLKILDNEYYSMPYISHIPDMRLYLLVIVSEWSLWLNKINVPASAITTILPWISRWYPPSWCTDIIYLLWRHNSIHS